MASLDENNSSKTIVLSGIEAVRRRPGMYIGDTDDGSGLHNMLWEVLGNALDLHAAGMCTRVEVRLMADGGVVCSDDGPGFAELEIDGIPLIMVALTEMHSGPTLDGHVPHDHCSLFGVGLFPVNALSARMRVRSYADGHCTELEFERAAPVHPLRRRPIADGRHGTELSFWPDPQIFSDCWFDPGLIVPRLRELAVLIPGLEFAYVDEREHRFRNPEGLIALLRRFAPRGDFELTFDASHEQIRVEAALNWRLDHYWTGTLRSYANLLPTTGGAHVTGLIDGLTVALAEALNRRPRSADSPRAKALRKAVTRGLNGVLCVRLQNPKFCSPSREVLYSPDAATACATVTRASFGQFLEQHPELLARLQGIYRQERNVGRARKLKPLPAQTPANP